MAGRELETVPLTDNIHGAQGPFEILVLEGPDKGARKLLEQGPTRVGSGEEADFVLSDPTVSRVHVEIRVSDGAVEVIDQGSRNGTLYLGQQIQKAVLVPGASLQLGRTTIALQPLAARAEPRISNLTRYGALVGESLAMRRLFGELEPIEACTLPVLIEGETGTGKELVAREIHARSPRARQPFIVMDCAAAQATLFESALFGHRRGAFTDAVMDRPGAAVAAEGGTLFLDEMGELDLSIQPKLLRFLERREITPLGAEAPRKVDVRILAATNRDLDAEVGAGRFRADLFHRLAVLRVKIPSLRERPEDIPLLVRELEKQIRDREDTGSVPLELIEKLKRYPWPGNIRELRNVVARSVSLGEDLPVPWEEPAGPAPAATPALDGVQLPLFHEARAQIVEAFERHYLERLLAEADWNLSESARRAGLHRNYVARLVAKHGLKSS